MLDFSKIKKPTFSVKTKDGEKISVFMPTKKGFEEINEAYELLSGITTIDMEKMGQVYDNFALILSRNSQNRAFSKEQVEKEYDLIDIKCFFDRYLEFVGGEASNPN